MLKLDTFQKLKNIWKIGPRCDFEPKRDQRLEPGAWTFGSRGPQGRPQVHARVKRKKGAAERKKYQERTSKACGKKVQRDLNTPVARGLANIRTTFGIESTSHLILSYMFYMLYVFCPCCGPHLLTMFNLA